MDRFIGTISSSTACVFIHLKSNMDRFIVHSPGQPSETSPAFKIQYG